MFSTNSRDRGSTSRTLEAWAKLLPTQGVEPVVTVGGDGPLLDALRQAGTAVYEHRIREYFDWRRPAPFLAAIAKLAYRIRQSGVQLMHVNEHEHYQVPARAARLAGIPVVVHLRYRPEPAMCRWLFKPPYTPERVFFTSRTQMRDTEDAVGSAVPRDRFRLLYDGLDPTVFGNDGRARQRLRAEWGIDDDTLVIGTASSISPRKRIDHIIRAVALLAASGLKVRSFIAGQPYFPEDERELARLQQLVAELGVGPQVQFLGYVEPAEPLYYAWDICVSASEYETFGMSVLEAMACGCPVVAYPGGSVPEVLGEAGVVVADGDLQALTQALHRLATDQQALATARSRARLRALAFDVRAAADTLAEEYRAVLTRS